jgi:hypothetical protein
MTETVLSKNPRREHIWEFLAARVAPLLGVIFQLLAIVALATVAINAVGYSKAPFIGSFVEHTLLINMERQKCGIGFWQSNISHRRTTNFQC